VARESELARLTFVYDERGATPQVLAEFAAEPLPGIAAQRTIDSDSGDSIRGMATIRVKSRHLLGFARSDAA
jgi:hypothetical protein